MSLRVRLTQLDGKLPNLALMKLSHWHKAKGDEVVFTRQAERDLLEGDYDRVYGSAIFDFTAKKLARFLAAWPGAIVGGTGTPGGKTPDALQVEQVIGCTTYDGLDYSLYPDFPASIGYTQRGCRFNCAFCCVPGKEGKPRSVATIADVWRGRGHPKKLHLLDNDFFGVPKPAWKACIEEIGSGDFRVCFSQGINIRVITREIAAALASVEYRDGEFRERRLYTAWDMLGDEAIFFRGVDLLEAAGVPPRHLMPYMLVGFDPGESWPNIWHRFNRMVERGIEPFPMVYDCRATEPEKYRSLKQFQRWVVTGLYRAVPFEDYDAGRKRREREDRQLEMVT